MNETIKSIMNRRSCRAYQDRPVAEEDIKQIVESGLWAPSGLNRQSWHFSVVQSAEFLGEMSAEIKKSLPQSAKDRYKQRHDGREDYSMFYGAPALILVSVDGADDYGVVNGGLATQNMCLAAESLGLSTCIIGLAALLFDSPEAGSFRERLRIPEGYKPLHALIVGYGAKTLPPPKRLPDRVDFIQ